MTVVSTQSSRSSRSAPSTRSTRTRSTAGTAWLPCGATPKERRGDRLGIYLSTTLVSPDGPVVDVLFTYVCQVLDATGARNGPAHVEVMITGDGPRLIEIGARLAGAEQQELTFLGARESDHPNGPPPSG